MTEEQLPEGSIATVAALMIHLRRGELDQAAAEQALVAATAFVETIIDQPIARAEHELIRDGNGRRTLMLPYWPLHAVSAVAVDGRQLTETTDYTWSTNGWLTRAGGRWPAGDQAISLTVDSGHDPIPAALADVVVKLAGRNYSNPQDLSALNLDGVNIRYTPNGPTGAELAIINRYRARV